MSKTKISLILMLAGTVAFFAGFWLYSAGGALSGFDIGVAVFVVLVTITGLVVGMGRLKEEKKGLAVDDELSRQIVEKAGAKAFAVSFYIWTFVLIFFSNSNLDIEVLIGTGIAGMAISFMGFWLYHKQMGVSSENQD